MMSILIIPKNPKTFKNNHSAVDGCQVFFPQGIWHLEYLHVCETSVKMKAELPASTGL